MRLANYTYLDKWNTAFDTSLDSSQTLLIVFGSPDIEKIQKPLNELAHAFSQATIIGASTAGEITQDELLEDALVVSVICFERTKIRLVSHAVISSENSFENGSFIAKSLMNSDLKSIFVLSEGLNVNGSQLTKGINTVLPNNIVVTGGLAGDGDRFEQTWVIVEGEAKPNFITAVGFYGESIHVGYGSKGGWDRLGMSRKVTRSHNNVLYELDGQPALDIYKRYLGEQAEGLPATGLLFPLELQESDTTESKVRTILAVNEEEHSITFAGDIPEESYVTLMKANFDRLIDGASEAAEMVVLDGHNDEPVINIAISCVGRRLVLKQRTEDELEVVLESLPPQTKQIGFYSYGEISPLATGSCDLHNQTMTLTLIWESDAPTA